MVSPTKHTENVRARKKKTQGRGRKNQLAKHGTTPNKEEMFKVVTKES